MNNVYFGKEGMTSTTANFYANIAKEMIQQTEERLNGVKFYQTSIAAIGSPTKQLMNQGISDISFIEDALKEVAEANAFCAWVREAIKEKEAQQLAVSRKNLPDWANEQGLEYPTEPEYPEHFDEITEKNVIDSWDINRRNKYLKLEAFASTIGKYIHPNGAYSKARIALHKAVGTPITKEGSGRDLILYYTDATVEPDIVNAKFLSLQDWYRSYEKQLNQMKAELKEEVNKQNQTLADEFQTKVDQYYADNRTFNNAINDLRNKFNKWRISENERISQLKIVIPKDLEEVFQRVKSVRQ